MRTAIIYCSKTGNTKKVAEYIASKIGAEIITADASVDASRYDKVIIGTGVFAGKLPKAMNEFIDANKGKLSDASLFVTCLYKGDKGAAQLERLAGLVGVSDAIFFNKVKDQIAKEDSKLNEYIRTLM